MEAFSAWKKGIRRKVKRRIINGEAILAIPS
jgi:hypothetical protein